MRLNRVRLFAITFFFFPGELHDKQISRTNKKRRELHGATVVSLYSPQHITINPLSVLQAAHLNNSNKTPPSVKLLQNTQLI